ncbi:Endophilin-B1 [Lamellibrachia satsuma]|nr:Endophilin-B1 [Lamellibrachia satsuma]
MFVRNKGKGPQKITEAELRVAQAEFDRQVEITKLLLEGISSSHAHHLRCLHDFVEAQSIYYSQCQNYMADLQKQIGISVVSASHTSCNNTASSGGGGGWG